MYPRQCTIKSGLFFYFFFFRFIISFRSFYFVYGRWRWSSLFVLLLSVVHCSEAVRAYFIRIFPIVRCWFFVFFFFVRQKDDTIATTIQLKSFQRFGIHTCTFHWFKMCVQASFSTIYMYSCNGRDVEKSIFDFQRKPLIQFNILTSHRVCRNT